MKNLVIVESPAKARTIKNFLDNDYTVIASKGHIKDLAKSTLSITIDDANHSFTPKYTVSKDHKDVAEEIVKLAKKSKQVYIATDEDREGEAIGFHIASLLGNDIFSYPRIVFHEITKKAILHALQTPKTLDINKINAQQARRLLDRIVGFKLSSLLASKIQRGLSAGRVQSAALKLVVDKEIEIENFKPIIYFNISAKFNDTEASLYAYKNEKIKEHGIREIKIVEEMLKEIEKSEFVVLEINKKERIVKSPPPFMTSTLQQSSSTQLGYSPSKTMQIAQKLYEGVQTNKGISGVITYMRTDSLNIANEAIEMARDFISKNYKKEYLPKSKKIYTTKQKSAQEAHEAIRPTDVSFTPQIAQNYLKNEELKLYTLIYNRFLASQMSDAKFESQSIIFSNEVSEFKATGRKLIFDGFYTLLGNEDKDKLLKNFKEKEVVKMSELKSDQKQTEPPARFTEASLIKMLESLGIGRPSTYAPTISLLLNREYIISEKKLLKATDIAKNVIEILNINFSDIVDSNFTANLENKLDEIAENKLDWQKVLWDFYQPFMEKIELGKTNIQSQKLNQSTGENCPLCNSELLLRSGRYGNFIGCSNYPKCRYIKQEKAPNSEEETMEGKCEICNSNLVKKVGKFGEFIACANYPQCKFTIKTKKEAKKVDVSCPNCSHDIVEKMGRRGAFYACSNYPKCKTIFSNRPIKEPNCSKCNGILMVKELKSGTTYECFSCKSKFDSEFNEIAKKEVGRKK